MPETIETVSQITQIESCCQCHQDNNQPRFALLHKKFCIHTSCFFDITKISG